MEESKSSKRSRLNLLGFDSLYILSWRLRRAPGD